MVILGEVLVVGGSALVVCSAIFWAWSAIKQKLSRGPDEALANRRKCGDDEKPRRGSGRRGAILFLFRRLPGLRVECARPIAFAMLGGNPGREVAVECLGGSDSDGVCLVRSRRNDAFFCT